MGSSKPPVADGYDRYALEADINAVARLTRVAHLATLAILELGGSEHDTEAVAHVCGLASDAAARVMRACGDAPDDTDWLGLRERAAEQGQGRPA